MKDELELAARVHYSCLPEHYEDDWLEVNTRLMPKFILGGDYCSVIPLGEQRYMVCICDAVGHGIASALYAARINTFVLTSILEGNAPCELIDLLNEFLCSRLPGSGMYASFFVVFINTKTMEMKYAGAGHPAALHISTADNQTHLLESQTTLLGIEHPLLVDCPLETHPISPGDKILLYTDGFTEARNSNGEELGYAGLINCVKANAQQNNKDFVDGLYEAVQDFSSGEVKDDMLCMSILVK
ncbi:MAG: serine/threonine-protein phosphatase [Gammaproteobacteria bacterium]|nr:serine/threonine-protein phosphatase [Gammaproteobacteria bacterium]MCK5093027.1 serine/threonine-protein phosphatase [Gammaproteobacteria bacterium]